MLSVFARTRASVRPNLLRSFATGVTAPVTKVTTLENGLTVATESNAGTPTATVGVWIDAGSRGDSNSASGTAHFLEHMAFKGTQKRGQHQLELEVENLGAHLNAYTSREHTVYYAKSFAKDVDKSVEILSDILQNSKLEPSLIENERGVILREQEEVDKITIEVVFDHLHSVAFQGQPLGRTILGPKEHILSIQQKDLKDFIAKNYKSDRIVLVGTGGVEHESLVDLAKKHLSGFTPSTAAEVPAAKPDFIGSEVRVRDDSSPTCSFAIAVEGVSWNSPDYYAMLVLQSIVGNWDRSLGSQSLVSSRLAHIVSANNLANSFMSFSTSYADTGLWGIYCVSENLTNLDDLTHFTMKEWRRLATSATETEVERAKSQLKAGLLLSLDGNFEVAEDIGRQLLSTGKRASPEEVEAAIDAVTVSEIQRVARKYIWDKDVAIAAVGATEGLPDYLRIRSATASLLF